MTINAAYLAPEGLSDVLEQELGLAGVRIDAWHGRLALSPDPPVASAWALDVWTAPREIPIESVKQAADALRAMQRNWGAYGVLFHRRMALISERLPPMKLRPLVFPTAAPNAHLGAWTLLTPNLLLASPTKTSPFINGECRFEEDHIGPPSRAYLKLWEALALLRIWPGPGDVCLDLGAAPGGWTWAVAQLGAAVTGVDKAPPDPRVAALPGVSWRMESAFGLAPFAVDWLFSDVIAYPERLFTLINGWIATHPPRHAVCTLKFQGETDHAAAAAFAAIPGGRVVHILHNKHELTFLWSRPDAV